MRERYDREQGFVDEDRVAHAAPGGQRAGGGLGVRGIEDHVELGAADEAASNEGAGFARRAVRLVVPEDLPAIDLALLELVSREIGAGREASEEQSGRKDLQGSSPGHPSTLSFSGAGARGRAHPRA